MKKIVLFFILFTISFVLYASNQTVSDNGNDLEFWSGMKAEKFDSEIEIPSYKPEKMHFNRSWSVVDSIPLKYFLNTSVSGGYFVDVYFDRNDETLHTFCSDPATITETAKNAIQKAPKWIRPALLLKFKSIPSNKQNLWGNLILDTSDPYVDEVAFSIATLSPAYLMSMLANPDVIVANAIDIYVNDISINYADVVDYGTSNDDDYYSTVRYWKMDETGNLTQVEMPKMIYYWYIAHPKITDEIPAFIDPTILEYDHHANIVPQSQGFFWRDYIFATTFHDTLNLMNMIQNCNYVWDGVPRAYPGGDWFAQPVSPYGDSLNYAIHLFTKWINGDMEFTSPGDRPHQPVRIAYKGMGRCGEYADLNAAVARALLIPATSISNWVNIWDHTFTELWQEDFIHYESYYWEWGTSFYNTYSYWAISPYEIRSDGYLRTVTEHYLDYSVLNVHILDSADIPIDGAKVELYVERPDDGIRKTMEAWTNNQGVVTFTVSDSFPYYAKAITPIGSIPPSGTALLIENPLDGEEYDLALNTSQPLEQMEYSQVEPPQDTQDDYRVEVQFTVPKYAVRGNIRHDDIDGDGSTKTYDLILDNGTLDFFVTDQNNSDMFLANLPFEAVETQPHTNGYSLDFSIPDTDNWHFIFANRSHAQNAQYLDGYVKLYHYEGSSNHQDQIVATTKLMQSYPNPYKANEKAPITLRFSLKCDTAVDLGIYNLKGQKIRTLVHDNLKKGLHKVNWDGKNAFGKKVASGIYLYKLKTKDNTLSKKMLIIR
jgi:hypothetical protein